MAQGFCLGQRHVVVSAGKGVGVLCELPSQRAGVRGVGSREQTESGRRPAFRSKTWLFARRDCAEDLRRRLLYEMERLRQGLLVAVPELNV